MRLCENRALIVVAHPDDESIATGGLLQRTRERAVAFCTTGAGKAACPDPERRRQYAGIRQSEASQALSYVGGPLCEFLENEDGELFTGLEGTYRRLTAIAERFQPTAIVTHAMEGAHQDHDSCAMLGWRLGAATGIPVWEMPLYRWDPRERGLARQSFEELTPDVTILRLNAEELDVKKRMLAAHRTQRRIIEQFDPSVEYFRPQTDIRQRVKAFTPSDTFTVTHLGTVEFQAAALRFLYASGHDALRTAGHGP